MNTDMNVEAMRQKTVQWTVLAWSQMECWEINTKHYWSWIPASRSVTERRGFKAYSATAARHEAGGTPYFFLTNSFGQNRLGLCIFGT